MSIYPWRDLFRGEREGWGGRKKNNVGSLVCIDLKGARECVPCLQAFLVQARSSLHFILFFHASQGQVNGKSEGNDDTCILKQRWWWLWEGRKKVSSWEARIGAGGHSSLRFPTFLPSFPCTKCMKWKRHHFWIKKKERYEKVCSLEYMRELERGRLEWMKEQGVKKKEERGYGVSFQGSGKERRIRKMRRGRNRGKELPFLASSLLSLRPASWWWCKSCLRSRKRESLYHWMDCFLSSSSSFRLLSLPASIMLPYQQPSVAYDIYTVIRVKRQSRMKERGEKLLK